MISSRILILNRSKSEISQAVFFAFKHFGTSSNQFVILLNSEATQAFEDIIYERASFIKNEKLRILRIGEKAISELKNQLFFSDVLVSDSYDFSYVSSLYEKNKSCTSLSAPCFIVPENTSEIYNVILLYNSTEKSIHTIKLFCNLFKGFCESWEVSLLDLTPNKVDDVLLMKQKLLVQYLKIHCPNLAVHRYRGEDIDKLRKLLEIKSNSLLVTGGELQRHDLEFFMGDVNQAFIYQPLLK